MCLILHNGIWACMHALCVVVQGGLRKKRRGGGGRGSGVCGAFCVCVSANVCVCVCHSRACKKIFLLSKDINKVLSLEDSYLGDESVDGDQEIRHHEENGARTAT